MWISLLCLLSTLSCAKLGHGAQGTHTTSGLTAVFVAILFKRLGWASRPSQLRAAFSCGKMRLNINHFRLDHCCQKNYFLSCGLPGFVGCYFLTKSSIL